MYVNTGNIFSSLLFLPTKSLQLFPPLRGYFYVPQLVTPSGENGHGEQQQSLHGHAGRTGGGGDLDQPVCGGERGAGEHQEPGCQVT
jgi:hypothetical protein